MEKSCITCKHGIYNNNSYCTKSCKSTDLTFWESNKPLVTIPKEVAKAIDAARKYVDSDELILSTYTEWSFLGEGIGDGATDVLIDYFNDHPHDYIRAIQEDYQVELTPREQILKWRDKAGENRFHNRDDYTRYTLLCEVIKVMGWDKE